MMNATEKLFFSLIKSALGTGRIDAPLSLSASKWQKLYRLSLSQNLSTIIFEELTRIGNNIPENLRRQWQAYSDYSLAKFDAQLMALTHLSQLLKEHGIPLMVLKGLGLALLYPTPQGRECADVDIYCFGEYERVNTILTESGLISGLEEENDKHCSFCFDGVNIENHRLFCEYVNHANISIGDGIYELSETDTISDERIPGIIFPGPLMGAMHLTMHTLSHMAWSGINTRHLIDCTLYFNKNRNKIDRTALFKALEDSGTLDAAKSLYALCGELFGLETGLNLLNEDYNQKYRDFILKSILNPCLPSSETSNPLSKFIRKYKQFQYRSSMHRIVYGEPFPDSFWKSFAIIQSLF